MKIVFLAFDKKFGFLLHFLDWIREFSSKTSEFEKLTVVTTKKERSPGLLDELRKLPVEVKFVEDVRDLDSLEVFSQCDVVHCHGNSHGLKILEVRRKFGFTYKIVLTLHSFKHGSRLRPIYTNVASMVCLNKVDALHFVSESSKTEFLSGNFVFSRNIRNFSFPLGVNLDRYRKSNLLADFPFKDELERTQRNIIYLAKFIPRKNHLWLVKNVGGVLREFDARLWLFGDDSHASEVKRHVESEGLGDFVKIPGRVDGEFIPSILAACQIAVCTAESETMGHTIMEPLCAGVPVVTFDVGIASSVIRNFSTGFIVKGRSEPLGFQESVRYLLKFEKERARMGEEAFRFGHDWLGWDKTVDNCLGLYRQLV